MKIKIIPTIAITTVLLLISAALCFGQKSSSDMRGAIESANKEFMQAFAKGDSAAIAALYSEKGQLLQPNGEAISGRPGIQSYWKGAIASGLKELKLETMEVEGMGDTAAEVGKYSAVNAQGQAVDNGKYIVLWKRENGKWKLYRDIWNSNLAVK